MARIAGVNVPDKKRLVIALTYIHGIGHTTAQKICEALGIDLATRAYSLSEAELNRVRDYVNQNCLVEGERKRTVSLAIKHLVDIGCYRGIRHVKRLPLRGQRTRTNAKTRKGKSSPIAGKKKVA